LVPEKKKKKKTTVHAEIRRNNRAVWLGVKHLVVIFLDNIVIKIQTQKGNIYKATYKEINAAYK